MRPAAEDPTATPSGDPSARNELLARLVPALAHRTNNALLVLRGSLEAGVEGGPISTRRLLEVVDRIEEGLHRTSLLAKPPGRGANCDLAELLEDAHWLLELLLRAEGVATRLVRRGDGHRVGLDPTDLLQRLVVLAGDLASRPGAPAEPPPAGDAAARDELRISLHPGERRSILCLLHRGAPREGLSGSVARAALVADASRCFTAAGGALRFRELGPRVRGYRVVLPSSATLAAARPVPARLPARVLVLDPDPQLAELLAAILREEGCRVVASSSATGAAEVPDEACDLVLAGAEWCRGADALVRLRRAQPRAKLAILGTAAPLAPAWLSEAACILPRPPRPDDLIALVREL